MLKVAEHINEVKRRYDLVGRIVNKKGERESIPRPPVVSRGVSKKFLRSSQKAKQMVGLAEPITDDQLDNYTALVDSTRSKVLSLTTFFLEWSKDVRLSLEAQMSLVEAWMELCAPMEGEIVVVGGSYDRLGVFLEECLKPVIAGPWKVLVSCSFFLCFVELGLIFISCRTTKFGVPSSSRLSTSSVSSNDPEA